MIMRAKMWGNQLTEWWGMERNVPRKVNTNPWLWAIEKEWGRTVGREQYTTSEYTTVYVENDGQRWAEMYKQALLGDRTQPHFSENENPLTWVLKQKQGIFLFAFCIKSSDGSMEDINLQASLKAAEQCGRWTPRKETRTCADVVIARLVRKEKTADIFQKPN